MDGRSGSNSVSATNMRQREHFDRVGALSASSAYIVSFPNGSRNIQRSHNDVHRAVREDVHRPTLNHNQLVLQQQHWPPSNVAVANAYTVHPNYQVPIAFEARPTQVAYPSPTVTPSRLRAVCHACGTGWIPVYSIK